MPLVIPHLIAPGGTIPGANLDDNWNVIRDWINARNPTVGPIGSRPAAGNAGAVWIASDQNNLTYVDNGSAWVAIGVLTVPVGTGTQVGQLGGVIDTHQASVGNDANTNEKVLHSLSVSANSLAVDGQAIHVVANGLLANNGDNKTVRFRLNGIAGTVIVDSGTIVTAAAIWELDVWVTRAGTNVVDANGTLRVGVAGGGVGAVSVSRNAYLINQPVTLTGAWTLDITGQAGTGNANDVTCRFSRAIWYPKI